MADKKSIAIGTFIFLGIVLTWIACCVAFGGELHRNKGTKYFWDYYKASGDKTKWKDCDGQDFCKDCKNGGNGLIVVMVFAFLSCSVALIIASFRSSGRLGTLSCIGGAERLTALEFYLHCAVTLFFFLGVIIWGATCYAAANKVNKVTATGYAFIIIMAIWMLFLLVAFHFGRVANPTWLTPFVCGGGGESAGSGSGGQQKQAATKGGGDAQPAAQPEASAQPDASAPPEEPTAGGADV